MKKNSIVLICFVLLQAYFALEGRVVSPGESLWSMQRLVTQASCDFTIRQSDFSAGALTISAPGVYCLAENITGAITIGANNIVLDLNSKTLTSSSDGVSITGRSSIEVRNGTIIAASASGVSISSSSRVSLKLLNCTQCTTGIDATNTTNIYVEGCELIGNDIGLQFDTVSRSQITNSTATDSMIMGFFLDVSSKNMITNCAARNTGEGLTDQTEDIYGFVAQDGSSNLFQNCIAQNTLASTVTGSINIAAGFALTGTENRSEISNCTSGVVETSANGFAIPFGILLDYSFDTLTSVTGEVQGAFGVSVAWSPDGAYLATGGEPQDGDEIQIFSFDRSTETLISITGENQGISCSSVAWFPDGTYLATGGNPEGSDEIQIFSFDPVAGLLTKTDGKNQGINCDSVAWSPDGAYLASGGRPEGGDEIQIFSFDRSAGTLTKLDGKSQGTIAAFSVAWSPDGTYLASGGQTETPNDEIQIFSFDRSTGTLTKTDGKSQGTSCNSVAWSPDGAYLASGGLPEGSDEIQIFSFDQSTGTLTKTDGENQGTRCRSLAWSPDGEYLACGGNPEGSDEIQIFSFDRSTGTLTKIDAENQGTECDGVAWSPDGAYLATTGDREGANDIRVFRAFIFPSSNAIIDNLVYGAIRASSLAAGVGISGSSIENMITGNRSYNNGGFNYQLVTNVFDERFSSTPSLIQNISVNSTPPFYAP